MSSPEGSSILFRRAAWDVRPRALAAYARRLRDGVAKGREFECLITGDAELRKLNREFRGKDEATDVLSFPSGASSGVGLLACAVDLRKATAQAGRPAPRGLAPPGVRDGSRRQAGGLSYGAPLGSIAISLARARAQARAFRHSTEAEVRILMLHGLLHLLGYDHETDSGRMARAEKRWRAELGLPNGLIGRVQP
jgi:probable rRNA maturation factor